jgi:predicted small integral membrane protein
MKERIKILAIGLISAISVLVAGAAQFAFASNVNSSVTLPNPISATSFTQVVGSITKYLILIAIPLTAIMVLVGGFQMITASGDPEKFSKGRKTLMYAAIGFAIVILASGVAAIIQSFLGVKSQ